MSSDSGFGAAGPRLALYLVTQALRDRDRVVFGACPPYADRLLGALEGVPEWMGLRRRQGGFWVYGEDASPLMVPGGDDLVVMVPAASAGLVHAALGMAAPGPNVLARVVGGVCPELLAAALNVVDPPPSLN